MALQPHIKVDQISKFCLMSGNPDRIELIANKLESPQLLSKHRGLVSYSGFTPKNRVPITLLTSGMGGPSTAIVMEEAYRAGCRVLIRVGSCGSLQPGTEHGIGTIYIPYSAIREDGASKLLVPIEYPAVATPDVYQALLLSAKQHQVQYYEGPVWTSDIYYGTDPKYFKKYAGLGATSVEMESSLLFVYPALKHDLKVASILTSDGNLNEEASIYNGDIEDRLSKFNKGVDSMIDIALAAIELLAVNE